MASQTSKPQTKAEAASEAASTAPQEHPFASVLDPWLKSSEFQWAGARNLNAMTQATAAGIHGALSLVNEATRFMNQRFHQDTETVRSLASCKTGEDVFRLGTNFLDSAMRDYADEAAKMAHLTADATQSAIKPFEDRATEALHSLATIPDKNGHFV